MLIEDCVEVIDSQADYEEMEKIIDALKDARFCRNVLRSDDCQERRNRIDEEF